VCIVSIEQFCLIKCTHVLVLWAFLFWRLVEEICVYWRDT
jgi:hypothetical protein